MGRDLKVVIVAAGRGSRMGPLTVERPKCLLEFAGRPLIDWQLEALAAAGLKDITLVTGYRSECLGQLGLPSRHNPDWAHTNMVASLMCARDVLESGSDIVVAYADIVYEPRVVSALRDSPADAATVVDSCWKKLWQERFDDPLSDAETLRLAADGSITEIGQTPCALDGIEGQYIGLTKLSATSIRQLIDQYDAADRGAEWLNERSRETCYFTDILTGLIASGTRLVAVPMEGGWLEFDSHADLVVYERLNATNQLGRFWSPPAKGEQW